MVALPEEQTGVEGLVALTRFARRAAAADLAMAFQAGEDGIAVSLTSDPQSAPRAFSLARSRLEAMDWSDGPKAIAQLALPSSILLALDRPLQQVLFIPTPYPASPRSGVLLLWASPIGQGSDCPLPEHRENGVTLLQPAFAQMMADHHNRLSRRLAGDRFNDLFETVPIGIVVLDGEARVALVNARAAALLGVTAGEVEARLVGERMSAMRARCRNRDALQDVYADLRSKLDYASTAIWASDESYLEVDTHPILGQGRNGRIWLFHDVTTRERMEFELRRQADTDVLTGLPNRRRFFESGNASFNRALAATGIEGRLSVLLLDIDHFKSANDRLGHPFGDVVLCEIARRCQSVLRTHDLMARMGGDEFAILLPQTGAEDAEGVAERLRLAIACSPIAMQGNSLPMTLSVGGTTLGRGDATLDVLIKRADVALYEAKRQGRNQAVSLPAEGAVQALKTVGAAAEGSINETVGAVAP
jgi:diguanylate cyclase (GGDEF)-like protein/PAS domain S-box-containing protein